MGRQAAGQPSKRLSPRWRRGFATVADTARISPLVRRVMKLLAERRALPRQRHAVELALREALANAIIHGSRRDPAKTVKLSVSGGPEGVRFAVSDEGSGFNFRRAPDPLADGHLHAHRGRGLFLIRRLMDKVRFARGGREIRMWKAERPMSRRRERHSERG